MIRTLLRSHHACALPSLNFAEELEAVRLRDGERQGREQWEGPEGALVDVDVPHGVEDVRVDAQVRRRHLRPDAHERVEGAGGDEELHGRDVLHLEDVDLLAILAVDRRLDRREVHTVGEAVQGAGEVILARARRHPRARSSRRPRDVRARPR